MGATFGSPPFQNSFLRSNLKNMTRHFQCLAIALVLLATACSKNQGGKNPSGDVVMDTLLVESYNIKYDDQTGAGSYTSWEYRKTGALAMLKAINADLFGLQEANAHELTFLVRNLPDYGWYGLGRNTGNVPEMTDEFDADECMAIFYNKKTIRMDECGTFWISSTPDIPSRGWDANCFRTVTWGRFTMLSGGQRLMYFNTHIDHRGVEAREKSFPLIVEKIKELNPEDLPVILSGDLNTEMSDVIIRPLRDYMSNIRLSAPLTDSRQTLHGYGNSTSVIDHIFFRGKGCKPVEYHTITEPYAGITYNSDHYSIYGKIALPRQGN